MELKQRLRDLAGRLWFYVVLGLAVLVGLEVRHAVDGTTGVVVAIVSGVAFGVVLTVAGLICAAWLTARRERMRSPRGD